MLIGFRVKNWRSLKDDNLFTMLAGKESQLRSRLLRVKKYNLNLLPSALIWGGNAAGKSNLIQAVSFMRNFILEPPAPGHRISSYSPYLFSESTRSGPSEFEIQILIDQMIYLYQFTLTAEEVLAEKLVRIQTNRDVTLFERYGKERIDFDSGLDSDLKPRLEFIFAGTQKNELFLSNSVDQNLGVFLPIYDWFKYKLAIITPHDVLSSFQPEVLELANRYLPQLDTGIKQVGLDEVSPDYIPTDIMDDIANQLPANGAGILSTSLGKRLQVRKDEQGRLMTQLLFAYHEGENGIEYKLDFSEESDGTRRLFDLLPVFALPDQSAIETILVDEIDRSLHTNVLQMLYQSFHQRCERAVKHQIIASTHDVQLMTQALFRRDQMWVLERKTCGTQLSALSDFKDIRYDRDIRKAYLEGRLGGIPKILTLQTQEG